MFRELAGVGLTHLLFVKCVPIVYGLRSNLSVSPYI